MASTLDPLSASPAPRPHVVADPGAGTPVADVRGLRRSFGDHVVLDGLDLSIRRGEFVALLGRSGSGKSTLLRSLAALDPVQEGTVSVDGTVSVSFQEPRLLPWRRVLDNVAIGARGDRRARRARAELSLAEVSLGDKADVWPVTLSGGQAQRASLARALSGEPDLLLLDEPFSALDALTRIEMHALVLGLWQRHGPGVLLVTHDVDEALALADRVIVLEEGRIALEVRVAEERPRDAVSPQLVAHRDALLGALGVATHHHVHEGAA